MRIAAWILLTLSLPIAAGAGERLWFEDPMVVPEWGRESDVTLGCEAGQLVGYASATDWADEIQVCFRLPEPEQGGPWLVEHVAFFLSGDGAHQVTIRDAIELDSSPGGIADDTRAFTPLYSNWPPEQWTYVSLRSDSACPTHLLRDGGECFMIGVELLPGDAIGLGDIEPEIRGWGLHADTWIDDTGTWNLTPAVRIGLTDLGLSYANRTTWGEIKDLFK